MTHDEAYADAMQEAFDKGYHEGAVDQERMSEAEIQRLADEVQRLELEIAHLDRVLRGEQ